jgi:hypothetical protein
MTTWIGKILQLTMTGTEFSDRTETVDELKKDRHDRFEASRSSYIDVLQRTIGNVENLQLH